MKRVISIYCLVVLISLPLSAQNKNFSELKNIYLGQTSPGNKPKIFAEGIVNTENLVYANVTFNPQFTEAAWTLNTADTTVNHGGIVISKYENGHWSEPKEVCFLNSAYNHRCPYYGLDGKRLYFQGNFKADQGWDQNEKFYYVEKTSEGWSNSTLLDTIFNKYFVHWQFSLDEKNNMYFGGELRGKENTGGIYFSEYDNGKYKEPKLIFKNTELPDAVFAPAISPNCDYILFVRIHPRGSTNPRIFSIYISFKQNENEWTKPQELGAILNMDGNQPRISPDGKYIFFVDNESKAYWVSSSIIEELRPKE